MADYLEIARQLLLELSRVNIALSDAPVGGRVHETMLREKAAAAFLKRTFAIQSETIEE